MSQNKEMAYELTDIRYEYFERVALEIPHLKIKKNQITSLIGSNGSGKTTLLNLLAFLEKPTSGQVSFFTEDTKEKVQLELRRRVALVSQNAYLLRGSVLENVLLGLKFHGFSKALQIQQAEQAMEMVGISDFSDRNVRKLSGGEAQKVTLARALALQPEVLLLDEPFSYLDQSSIEQLEFLLAKLTNEFDTTVVLSTHDQLQGLVVASDCVSLLGGNVVNSPLLNLFYGEIEAHYFSTGKIDIYVPEDIKSGKRLVVDPAEIVLSNESLVSSIRNNFQGRVIAISEDKGRVWITVDAGEKFYVQITRQSLSEMSINIGSDIWVNFKSTTVKVF